MRGGKNDKGKLWDSGDEETSSDEDFHWLQRRLADEEGELDDETTRLLKGVLTESYKDRKHPERYDRPLDVVETESEGDRGSAAEEESEFDLGKAGQENFIRPGNQFELQGLDPNEKGISREEQLRRMNILANEFNFYAIDRPDQKNLSKKPLEVEAEEKPAKLKRKKWLGIF